jgi:FtsP/CotA-like multicopper oxidase with cupredoxin domain
MIGQRYDVIVTADQGSVATDFWMRAIPQIACSDNDSTDNIRGIVHYGDSTSTPSTTGYSYTDSCLDESVSNLVPYVSKTVDAVTQGILETATVGRSGSVFRWFLNSTTMVVDWDDPTLLQLYNNETTFETSNAVIELPNAEEWAYVVIQTTLGVPHPIHLHGFDFFILAQGTGTYSASSVSLNMANPPRRDTAMLPASGYLVLAFETDNPGAWLMHCHIGWHTSEGFALQFLVRQDEIMDLVDSTTLQDTCTSWGSHATSFSVEQEDSGV